MSDPALPHALDLILPVLKAANQVGKSHYREIDGLAVELAGISDEQMAIEFEDDSSHSGPKVFLRTAWARSILKRIGVLDSHGGGVWGLTDLADPYLKMSDDEADASLRKAADEAYESKEPSKADFKEWREAAADNDPASMTVRELLGLWGVGRRWSSVNDRITTALENHGLRTEPDFESGGLDQPVEIVLREQAKQTDPKESSTKSQDTFMRVGTLPSATNGIVGVTPNDHLEKAQTVMWVNDFSQLAVITGTRDLKGAVSWESIARARLGNPYAELKHCVIDVEEVSLDTPILEAARRIKSAEYLFVRDGYNEVTGIVTTADLSDQFTGLAGPFLTMGEIERLLRIPIDHVFSTDELQEVVLPDDARIVDGSHSLSFGEIQRLLDLPSNWERLNWPVDRKVFVAALNETREIRNEIMHFSPDPIELARLARVDAFLRMVRELVAGGHHLRSLSD